jgi:hypothetical protein
METCVANSAATKAIRQQMENVRRDLDEDVQEIVESAREMRDWRSYVTNYPWVCLGTVFVAGYLIVPRRAQERQPDAETLAEFANQSRLLATSQSPPKRNARGVLFGFVGKLVMRGISSYVSQQVSNLAAAQADRHSRMSSHEEPPA